MTAEVMSLREIRRRLREVEAESCHLKGKLPSDNPHNRILTLADIGAWIIEQPQWLHFRSLETPPPRCDAGCRCVNECRKAPPCRKIEPYQQRRLSDFFHDWDAGTLVKAPSPAGWKITPRHPTLAQMVAAPGQKAHALGYQVTAAGPKLTWRS